MPARRQVSWYGRPDFMLIGTGGAGIQPKLIGSRHIPECESWSEGEEPDWDSGRIIALPPDRLYFKLRVEDFNIVVANSYSEAIVSMVRLWVPDHVTSQQDEGNRHAR